MATVPNIDQDVIIISDDDSDSDIRNHISETQETNDLNTAWIQDSELAGNNKMQIPLSSLSHIIKKTELIWNYKIQNKFQIDSES